MGKRTSQGNVLEIREQVKEALARGEDRGAIVEDLHKQYYDRNTLSLIVAGVPDPEKKHLFRRHNNLLVICLSLVAVIQFAAVVTSLLLHGLLPFAPLIRMAVVFIFRPRIRDFAGLMYWPFALLALSNLAVLSNPPPGTDLLALVEALLSSGIAILSFVIARNVFPQLGPFGVRKDINK